LFISALSAGVRNPLG